MKDAGELAVENVKRAAGPTREEWKQRAEKAERRAIEAEAKLEKTQKALTEEIEKRQGWVDEYRKLVASALSTDDDGLAQHYEANYRDVETSILPLLSILAALADSDPPEEREILDNIKEVQPDE